MERRLAAILAADVVGYSRLVREDEAGTLTALKGHLEKLIEPKIAEHNGRIVKLMGDGLLAEFSSAVEAVQCAVEIQYWVGTRAAEVAEDRRVAYRIGINIGDIVVEGADIYGDGVNVAARIEGLAEPGGICLARNVFNQVKDKLALTMEHLGEREVKNIAEPVSIYCVVLDEQAIALVTPVVPKPTKLASRRWVTATAAAAAIVLVAAAGGALWWQPWVLDVEPASLERTTLPLPDRPSIAVLPFVNMSNDSNQDYFADGLTDDLITDLSKISDLFVIARNSTFVYKGQSPDVRQVASDLGVRYVLEGSVRRAGDQVRVNAQLIEANTGGHVWAERYDGSVAEIFSVQDSFVRKIVGALALNLSAEEQKEIARGQTANLDAREAFEKGWDHYLRFTPGDNAQAADYLLQAAKLDPAYGRAYSALGMVYVRGCQWRWNKDLGVSVGEANSTAQLYLSKGEKHSSSLTNVAASQIHLYNERHDEAFTQAARAVALDPNDPEAHVAMGLAMITTGRPEAGLKFVEIALRLNPSHPNHYVLAHGMAYFSMGDLEQAAAVLQEGLQRDPGAVELAPLLAAIHAQLGHREEARAALQKWQPDVEESRLEDIGYTYHVPYKWADGQQAIQTRFIDGLLIAGLPLDVTVESLAWSLRNENVTTRKRAALYLSRFGPSAAEAVPALIEALGDEDRWVQVNAVKALGKIGPAATAAIPALMAMQGEDADASYVTKALKMIRFH